MGHPGESIGDIKSQNDAKNIPLKIDVFFPDINEHPVICYQFFIGFFSGFFPVFYRFYIGSISVFFRCFIGSFSVLFGYFSGGFPVCFRFFIGSFPVL